MKRTLFLLNLLLFSVSASIEAASFSVAPTNIGVGQTRQLSIVMSNSETNLGGFQMRLTLPQGISVKKNESGRFIYSVSDRIADHTISFTQMSDGSYQILCYSMNADVISGTSGEMLSISVTADDSFVSSSTGSLTNIKVTNTSAVVNSCDDVNFPLNWVIAFADENVKALCVANWDANVDGELSETEAAAVTDLGIVFSEKTTIQSFNELQYFISLTSIRDYAFFKCSGLSSITIPNSVKSIGECAFNNCSGLTSVTISSSVTSIGIAAFCNCSHLTSIYIPEGVTSIGDDTFYSCSGLTSIDIPNSVTSIGESAFNGCYGLTSVTIPSSVTYIGESAFSGCSGLTSIKVESGNTSYDSRDNCNAIIRTATNTLIAGCKNTVISSSVTSIGNYAFRGCSGLTSVTIPNSVASIGNYAFRGCSGLTSVTIPSSVTSIGRYAFRDCSGLTSVVAEMETPFAFGSDAFYSIGSSCVLTVPYGTRDAYIAAGWTENVFKGGIVEAPAPGQNIDFADATVKALCVANWDTNGDGELSVAEAAAVRDLGEVFKQNTSITSFDELQYFTGLTNIEQHAFAGCHGLTSVTIPESVTSIGDHAFDSCSGLTSVIIPNSVTSIENNAFMYCSGLTSVTIPESVTSIGTSAFYDCGLTSVTIPNSVTTIGEYAFSYCSGLTSVIIPESVTSIGDCAFNGCSSLSSVSIPESVTSIGNLTFEGCISLTSVTIPKGVTSIGDGAFSDCSGLASVTLLEGVKRIGSSAFYNCSSLTSVTLPNSVTSIGSSAFADCSSLSSVVAKMETPFRSFAFSNIGSSCVLTVPYGTRDAYIAAGWTENVFKGGVVEASKNIVFADANVKALCVANWDTNGDGELSEAEAAAVTDLGTVFKGNKTIQTFDELQYFTGLTSIAGEAFRDCTNLTSVIIPASNITEIKYEAFMGCSFSSITLSEGLTRIGDRAFANNPALTSVVIPSTVTDIFQGAFMNCGALTSITLPDGLKTLTLSSLRNTSITSITLPSSLEKIEHNALDYCKQLTAITIPENVTTIEECAFANCSSLSSVVSLVQSPATIVKNVFMSISPDCVLTIPQVTCYEDYVAKGWTPELFARIEPSYIIFADNAVKAICLQNWDADHDGMLTFAEAAAVTDLGNVFAGNTQIVTFNELKYFTGLSTLSADAFRGCSALTSITVPADLPSYGTLSFKGCTSLAEINIGTDRNVHNLGFVNKAQGWSDEGTVDCFCSEFWNKAFDTHQTLLVPNGSYRMKFKAFQRPADYTTAYNDYAAGNWESFAVVYANDTQKALKHICDGMQEQRLDGSDVAVGNSYIPNNMWNARVYFDAGLYADELEVEVTDGTLTFGVRGDYKQYSQWAIFSDFELSLKKVLATGIALNSESVTMTGTGETYSLYATVSPTDVTEKSVTWTSSDESVATVSSDGVVTAVANGTAIITATTNDGSNLSATCTVTNEIIPMSEWTKENTFNYNIQLVKANQNDHTYIETCQVDLEQVRSAVGEGKIKLYTRKDGSDSPYTRGYTCIPYPGFWMDEQGEYPVEYSSTTSYGMTFNETSGVITFYSKPWVDMVGNQYTSSFYLVNETNGKYVELNLNVSIIAEEPAVEPDTDISGLDNVVYMDRTEAIVGTEQTLSIKMKNTDGIQTVQFDLYLPDGVEVVLDDEGYELIELSLERTTARKMDQFSAVLTSGGAYRFLINSTRGNTFDGTDGEIATVRVRLADGMSAGDYPVVFRDVVLVNTSSVGYRTDYVKCTLSVDDYILGDVNNDKDVDAIDLNAITNYILERRTFPFTFNVKAGDVNGDSVIDAIDLNAVTNMILHDSQACAKPRAVVVGRIE